MTQIEKLTEDAGGWCRDVFGEASFNNRRERAMRVLEEAIELAQAEGVTTNDVLRTMAHVYSKPADAPELEGAGVGIALLIWAAGTGNHLDLLIEENLTALRARDPIKMREKIAMKRSKGLIVEPELTPYERSAA